MRALVTGMSGFIGAHLARRLVSDGWEVAGTVRPGTAPPAGLAGLAGVTVIPADLSAPEGAAAAAAADPDVVYLLAASRAEATPAERAATTAVNATSACWLVDAIPDRCRTVVRLGSSTEYAESPGAMDESTPLRPRGFFGATKAAGSLLTVAACARRGIRSSVLRAFQVYGPDDHPVRLVPTALRAARTGEPLRLTAAGMRRDWIFVDDVVEACVRAASADDLPDGQVLNVGTGRHAANEELVALVEHVTGRPVTCAADRHPGCPWDAASWVCDPALARELLGWEATVDLAEGLRRCWEAEHA